MSPHGKLHVPTNASPETNALSAAPQQSPQYPHQAYAGYPGMPHSAGGFGRPGPPSAGPYSASAYPHAGGYGGYQ